MDYSRPALIAVDLDDTALNELRRLNPVTLAVLREASSRGHKVMIATARPYCLTETHYRALGLDTPVCLCNGADYLLPGDERFPVQSAYLPADRAGEALELFEHDILRGVWVENNDALFIGGGWTGAGSPYFEEVYRLSRVRELNSLPPEGAGRLFVLTDDTADADERLARLRRIPGAGAVSQLWKPPGTPAGERLRRYSLWSVFANKWFCVEKTAAYYDIPPENIVTFGDDRNDLGMLRSAAWGFAMQNGSEIVRERVGRVTRWTNREGGVGREVNELLRLGMKLETPPADCAGVQIRR